MINKTSFLTKLVCVVVLILVLVVCAVNKKSEISAKARYGHPLIYSDKNEIASHSIDQIADDGERVYLLLNDHKGIVQIYNCNGLYMNSLAFYSHTNGAFRIAVDDGVFYVCDKQGNLYLFSKGEFIQFIDHEMGAALRRSIDFETNSSEYVLGGGDIWHIAGDSKSCIISRPKTAALHQGRMFFYLCIGVIFFGAIFHSVKKCKNQI